MKIYPYKMGSASAKALAQGLGIKQIKHEGKPLQVRGGLINWGSSGFQRNIAHDGVFNSPDCVRIASNKLEAFRAFGVDGSGVTPVDSTEARLEAVDWLAKGFDVVCRHKLNGHSGEGIEILEGKDALLLNVPVAPLYTKYQKKDQEYRLHVFRDKVFFRQRKARKQEVADDDVNWKVRNLNGGFIFANQNIECLPEWELNAISAVKALGLDFGAVDLITNKAGKSFVLEVNTAPGLTGATLQAYIDVFKEF